MCVYVCVCVECVCAFGVCSCVSLLQTNRLFYRIYLLTSKFDPLVLGKFLFVFVGEARRGVLKRKIKKDSEKKKKKKKKEEKKKKGEKERKKSRNLEEEKGVHTSK